MLPEREFIERVRRLVRRSKSSRVVRGIGDDCAVLQASAGLELLVTTDLCVEDVHFRRDWQPARSVGHRCLARGLSDIAAMGGDPAACFLSLAVPRGLSQRWIDEFVRGFLAMARRFRVPLAGGDTSSGPKIIADVVVLGTVPEGKAVLRSGARPGDLIYVTGKLGGAAAVLKSLKTGRKPGAATRGNFYPEPRVKVGGLIRQKQIATAMIDLSDGLSVDLAHICRESGVSAVIYAKKVPVARGATLEQALHGGEDYEVLFTARAGAKMPTKISGSPVTAIGRILPRSAKRAVVTLRDAVGKETPLKEQGWQHFARK